MAEVKWIKISTDIFDNRKIRQIECLPDGDALIVIWFKLLVLAGATNDHGMVYLTKEIPYTEQMLSSYFNRQIDTISMAMKTFESFGMIEMIDSILKISNWEKYQNTDGMERIREQTRLRVAKYRSSHPQLPCSATSNATVTQCNATDIDRDRDIKNKNIRESIERKPAMRFTQPTLEEVKAYCSERNNDIDPERFIDYYSANGWMVGKNRMKDWKATVRNWEKQDKRSTINTMTKAELEKKKNEEFMKDFFERRERGEFDDY